MWRRIQILFFYPLPNRLCVYALFCLQDWEVPDDVVLGNRKAVEADFPLDCASL
jgi:hypothetical protein